MSVFEIKDLEFSWPGQSSPSVKLSSFELAENESICLFGSSGSGKSTLLQLLSGVLAPNRGQVEFVGQRFSSLTSRDRDCIRSEKMGVIFQQFNLVPFLSVKENILLPLRFRNDQILRRPDHLHQRICELMKSLGLSAEELLHRSVMELSVGQQQRVAAVRAFIGRPKVILADEPTSALDPHASEQFFKLMFAQADRLGASIVCVSHDPTVRSYFSRSISLLDLLDK